MFPFDALSREESFRAGAECDPWGRVLNESKDRVCFCLRVMIKKSVFSFGGLRDRGKVPCGRPVIHDPRARSRSIHGPRFILAYGGLLPVVFRVTNPKGAHSGVRSPLHSYYSVR